MSTSSAALEKEILLKRGSRLSPVEIFLRADLLSYCIHDNVKALKEKLAIYDIDINASIDSTGMTMLMCAVQNNSKKILKFLLSLSEINVLITDDQGRTALDCMIESNCRNVDFDIARDLIKRVDKVDKIQHKPYLRIKMNAKISRLYKEISRLYKELIYLGAQLDFIDNEVALRIPCEKLYEGVAERCINLGAIIEKTPKTFLLRAWEQNNEEVAKILIQLGANVAFSESLYKATDYSNHPMHEVVFGPTITSCFQRLSSEPEPPKNPKVAMTEQIELSKEFFQEIEKSKWMGIAVAYICFQKQIDISLLEGFLVHKKTLTSQKTKIEPEMSVSVEFLSEDDFLKYILNKHKQDYMKLNNDALRKAYNLGYGMMKNRLIKGKPESISEPIPPTLLFTAQVEHREKELANEICWQQWQNNYYSNFPNRKDQPGYGPGAMIVAKCGR